MNLQAYPRFDSWESQLLQKLLDTPDLRFLWAMQETSGSQVKDYSGNARHGAYDGVTLNQNAPNRRINKMAIFDGINDKITPAAGCSVRGLGVFTWFAILEILNLGSNQIIWAESVSDADTAGQARFAVYKIGTNETLNVSVRSGGKSQAASSLVSNTALPVGICMAHIAVDIPSDTVVLYRNGSVVASTTSVNFGTDIIISDTAPALGPHFGRGVLDSAPSWYSGKAGYCGMYSRILTPTEILNHAKAGGFA